MTLNQLKINESATITAINCDEILKDRLYSFGISKGIKVTIVEFTLTKSTIEIKVNQSKIALRLNEAAKLGFKKVYAPKNSIVGIDIPEQIQVIGVTTLTECLKLVFG